MADYIHEIFHILLTMPVGSVPCERSISALRRFKSWNRTTMTEDRLNGLALLHTHKDKDVEDRSNRHCKQDVKYFVNIMIIFRV
jgi:hypothetical protein